jgi:hypothetical protein
MAWKKSGFALGREQIRELAEKQWMDLAFSEELDRLLQVALDDPANSVEDVGLAGAAIELVRELKRRQK